MCPISATMSDQDLMINTDVPIAGMNSDISSKEVPSDVRPSILRKPGLVLLTRKNSARKTTQLAAPAMTGR